MSTFDEVATGGRGRGKGCPVCGKPTAGQVALTLSKLGPKGSVRGGGRITSRAISMCETHAVDTYQRALAALTDTPAGG